MSKTSTLLSSLALVTGVASLTMSFIISGPMGPQGPAGSNGNPGTDGVDGSDGVNGSDGENGQTPYIGPNGNWWINGVDTNIDASGTNNVEIFYPQVDLTLTAAELDLYNEQLNFNLGSDELKESYVNDLVDNEGYIGISTPAELMAINNPTGKYVLRNSISFVNAVAPSWSPINFYEGESKIPFSGTFNGAGYEINGITYASIDSSQVYQFYGLFDELDGATIKNLSLANFDFFKETGGYMGVLAGVASNSHFENLYLYNNTLRSDGDMMGGIAGRIYNSTIKFVDVEILEIVGNYSLGGLAGEAFDSTFSKIALSSIYIDGKYSSHGGGVGYSVRNIYVEIQAELIIELGGNSLANERHDIGGFIGYSSRDRILYVQTIGLMEFSTLDENYRIENVGGVVGFAANSILYFVNNQCDISITYNPPLINVSIVSIGGVVGATEFVALQQVANEGIISINFDRANLDENIYINGEDHPIEYIGGIIGYVYGSAALYQVINSGLIQGLVDVGGIIGSTGVPPWFFQQFIYMNEVLNVGQIRGVLRVGGIMGFNDQTTNMIAMNMMNVGNVNAEMFVGGLFGLLSPYFSIKVTIKNSYNFGEIIVENYIAGGLIGGIVPYNFDFFTPIYGEVHLYHSFNIGTLTPLDLGFDGANFSTIGVGSIIGSRQLLTYMFDVTYIPQISNVELIEFNNDTLTFVPTGEFVDFKIDGVASGNMVDVKELASALPLTDDNNFYYQSYWDMQNVWRFVEIDENTMIPVLRFVMNP